MAIRQRRVAVTAVFFAMLAWAASHAVIAANSAADGYTAPTPVEMAPMPQAYLAELAKIHEPPEMSDKPLQARKPVPPEALELSAVMSAVRDPEKATHEQRMATINALLALTTDKSLAGFIDPPTMYAAIASLACIDGENPGTVIEYASGGLGGDDDALALRARMYLQAGERGKALDDLQQIMVDGNGSALAGGDAAPRNASNPCGWSIADLDAFGNDPRALAAKGLYLSSFIAFGAEDKGLVRESDIRDLYARSAISWRSPIPHFLVISLEGLGSEQSMAGARCIRANAGGPVVSDIVKACAKHDDGTRQEIRELTMALVIDPTFAPALAERADKLLNLAQASYADGKPSRVLFDRAINDFSGAITSGGPNKHTLYCDRGLALASVGRYEDALESYLQGMKFAKEGVEDSPFVYEQLAELYMKVDRFDKAASTLTQGIINSSGGGMDSVVIGAGMQSFRILYPEYDLLPDEILADTVRRRYEPQFAQSWDADFVTKKGPVLSTILADLYVLRGDAYMRAGRRSEAQADYRRVKSDAWGGVIPQGYYFLDGGGRNYQTPDPWPAPPPTS